MSYSSDLLLRIDAAEYWLITAGAALAAAVAFVAAFVLLRRARLIEDTPTSRIRSAAQGYVELEGEAVMMAGEPIIAPLTYTPCVWFRYRVEEYAARGGRGGNGWRTVSQGTSDGLFVLRDATGCCVIDPEGAAVTPFIDQVWYGDTLAPPPVRRGKGLWRLLGGARYRYREQRIHGGDHLYAIGELRASGGADGPGRADIARDLLTTWKRDQPALLARFDHDRNGLIDGGEWEQARLAADDEAGLETGRRLGEEVLLLSRPRLNRPFLLSALPPQRLITRYKRWAAASLLLSLGSGAAAVWLLQNRPA